MTTVPAVKIGGAVFVTTPGGIAGKQAHPAIVTNVDAKDPQMINVIAFIDQSGALPLNYIGYADPPLPGAQSWRPGERSA